ncbi:MAG: hypothetical protein LUI13_15825 [Lachnospiraceae bacterium]|nr:hypothetical protein [Lachnospiraceae bacterium]
MSSVKVDTTKVLAQQSSLQNYQNKVIQIEEEVESIRSNLNFNLKNRSQIANSLSLVETALQKSCSGLGTLGSTLADVMGSYQETEQKIKDRGGKLTKSEITEAVGTISGGGSSSASGTESGTSSTDAEGGSDNTEDEDVLLQMIKAILKDFEKYFDSEEAGFGGGLVSYLEKLADYFTGDKEGWSGASDWCDLAESSSKLWNALYKMLKSYDSTDALEKQFGKASAGLGIIGSVIGLLGGVFSMADTITTDGSTTGEKIAAGIDAAGEGIDVIKSVYDLKNIADKSTGPYSAAGLWATFAETITDSASQLAESISKYSADGSWSAGDTGATGVEMSVAGLSSLISGITFGIISPETFGTSAEDISSSIESWANDLGTKAGEYICSDPSLLEEYNNGNIFTRIALTFKGVFS